MAQTLPQGTITILFTDVVGSTALATSRGDAPAHDILRHQRELVRREIEQHVGHEVKTMGDGFMVVFGSARQAVTCAIGIQRALEQHNRANPREGVELRVGLNTGEAIAEDQDFFGLAVTAASRIMDKAVGGQILVSESVRAVLGQATDVRMIDRGRFKLKGFPDRARLYEVSWREATAAAARPIERLPFVHREGELAQLRRLLDRTVEGHGALVLISGEAGVGKTRLVEQFLGQARQRNVLTFTGHCYEDAGTPPYGPFVGILETAASTLSPAALRAALGDSLPDVARLLPAIWRMFPDVSRPAEPSAEIARHQMFAGIREFLARAGGATPMALCIDDLHWADDASIQLLRHLARTIGDYPALIVATYRDDPPDRISSLMQALDEWHRHRLATWMALRPFTPEEIQVLLHEVGGQEPPPALARALVSETGGNAFYAEELLRHLAEDPGLFDERGNWRNDLRIDAANLPRSLRVVVERGFARLSASARDAVAAASITGRSFDSALLGRVTGLDSDALLDVIDEAERAGIIAPEAGGSVRWRFAHALTRSVLADGLPSSRRQRLHLAVADGLERTYQGAPEHAAEISYHLGAAGSLADPHRTVTALRAAGDHAHQARANIEADEHYSEALRIAGTCAALDEGGVAALLHRLGRVKWGRGEWQESRALLDRATEIYRRTGPPAELASVLHSKAVLCTFDARAAEAIEHLTEAKRHAGGNERLMALILQVEAQNLGQLRQYARAREVVDKAIALAERLDDGFVAARVRMASGYLALSALDMSLAVSDFERAHRGAVPSDPARMASESRRAIALACLGQLDEAERCSAAARTYFRSADDAGAIGEHADERDPYESGIACFGAGIAAIARGNFEEALVLLREAVEAAGSPPNFWVVRTLIPMMVQIYHETGRVEDANVLIRGYLLPSDAAARVPAFAQLYAAISDPERRHDGRGRDLPAPPPHMPDLQTLAVTVLAAETAIAMRDVDFAGQQIDAMRHLHELGMRFTSGWVVLVPRLLGALQALRGEHGEARSSLAIALKVAESVGAQRELALTHMELADLEADPESARAHLAQARRYLTEARIGAYDRRLEQVAERLGAHAALPDGLTDDDAEVLRMIAAGLNNRTIARDSGLSEGAAQRRLSRVYSKIGVAGRSGAIAYAYKHGIARHEG